MVCWIKPMQVGYVYTPNFVSVLNLSKGFYLFARKIARGVVDCLFYSFEDELKQCPCGRGFCRNKFEMRKKFWCCPAKGDEACQFSKRCTSTQLSTIATHGQTFYRQMGGAGSVWKCLKQVYQHSAHPTCSS